MYSHDPYQLFDSQQNIDYEIDLGAERVIAAEKGNQRIAVEIKSFVRATILIDYVAAFHVPIGRVTQQSPGIYQFHYQLNDLPKTGDTAVFQLTADIPQMTGGFERMPIELKLPVE